MDRSPGKHDIEKLVGKPAEIEKRGNQIERLGRKMIASAATLERIADGADGQKGLAVHELQDKIGDVHRELKRAGEMYEPTGPYVAKYGKMLAEVKPKLNEHVENCEEYWAEYVKLPGYRKGQRPSWDTADEDDPEAEQDADNDIAKEAAYEAWLKEAELFDTQYETWDAAFEHAADHIGDILDGKIKDGTWDTVDGFVAGSLEVLKWAGIALAVAAFVIGGPLIAAAAAVVAVATLALTIYQKSRGDAGWKEVIIAGIGVIPFGSLGKGFTGAADDALGGLLTSGGRSAIGAEISTIFSAGGGFKTTLTSFSGLRSGFAAFARNHGGDGRLADSIARLFAGSSINELDGPAIDLVLGPIWTQLSTIDTAMGAKGKGLFERIADRA